jgi:hypothetical protein
LLLRRFLPRNAVMKLFLSATALAATAATAAAANAKPNLIW